MLSPLLFESYKTIYLRYTVTVNSLFKPLSCMKTYT